MKQHVVAEIGLTYKSKQPVSDLPQITDPESAAIFLRPLFDSDTIELQRAVCGAIAESTETLPGMEYHF